MIVATKIASSRHDCDVIPEGTGVKLMASAEAITMAHLMILFRLDVRAPASSSRELGSVSNSLAVPFIYISLLITPKVRRAMRYYSFFSGRDDENRAGRKFT
jgi:hypothetical protein